MLRETLSFRAQEKTAVALSEDDDATIEETDDTVTKNLIAVHAISDLTVAMAKDAVVKEGEIEVVTRAAIDDETQSHDAARKTWSSIVSRLATRMA